MADDSGPGQYFTDDNRDGKTRNTTTGREVGSSDSSGRWKDSKGASALRGAAAGSQAGTSMLERSAYEDSTRIAPVQFKRGGKVRKTGMAKVHRGERVIPAGKRKKVERLMKRNKMRMKVRS